MHWSWIELESRTHTHRQSPAAPLRDVDSRHPSARKSMRLLRLFLVVVKVMAVSVAVAVGSGRLVALVSITAPRAGGPGLPVCLDVKVKEEPKEDDALEAQLQVRQTRVEAVARQQVNGLADEQHKLDELELRRARGGDVSARNVTHSASERALTSVMNFLIGLLYPRPEIR